MTDGQAADGNDDGGPQKTQVPVEPEAAELDLARRWRSVTPAGRMLARIAARHRDAVERLVELVLVHAEPDAKRSSGAAASRRDDHEPVAGVERPTAPELARELFGREVALVHGVP